MTAFARYIGAAEFEEIAMADTKQSAWTPGPWSVSGIRTREGGEPVLQILGADDRCHAMVFYSDKTPAEHVASHADARLIAAAPAMLAALERAERKLSAYVDVCKDDKELTGTVLPMAREAIRLARGGGA